jgi:hypothetical protein
MNRVEGRVTAEVRQRKTKEHKGRQRKNMTSYLHISGRGTVREYGSPGRPIRKSYIWQKLSKGWSGTPGTKDSQ